VQVARDAASLRLLGLSKLAEKAGAFRVRPPLGGDVRNDALN